MVDGPDGSMDCEYDFVGESSRVVGIGTALGRAGIS